MKSSYNRAMLLPHTKLAQQNKRSIQIDKIGKNLTVSFFYSLQIWHQTEHLLRRGKSLEAFFNFVNHLNEQLLERLIYRSDHSDEERLRLLISWFDFSF